MKNTVVMTAIAARMESLHKVICNEKNASKPAFIEKTRHEICDLYAAYVELRGSDRGGVSNIHGMDSEWGTVQSIYSLVC